MALSEGTKLGRFDIVAPIGAGGMGEVYLARDATLNRDVALKILPPELDRDPQRFERFRYEAQAAGSLNHPNILTIYDIGCDEGIHYLVSELLDGETLADRIGKGPLSTKKAIDFSIQIASGLAAAHGKGIVHRDLKPANLFITRDGRVKILDFGLAKETKPSRDTSGTTAVHRLTEAGSVVGTPGYMSPEQIRGQNLDHRSDIFSFGCVLFEMLSGEAAFRGGSSVETMSSILNQEPDSEKTASFSPEVRAILAHCLEKSPDERVQSAQDLAFHLKVLSGASFAGLSMRTGGLPRKWIRARSALLGLLPGMIAGLAAAAWFATREAAPPIPAFQQLTFRRGWISTARFSLDGETILYGAAWDGKPLQTFATRAANPASRPLDLPPADPLAISPTGELAVSLGRKESVLGVSFLGTLARLPLEGQSPRELLTNVGDADWSPDGSELSVVHVVGSRYRLEYPIGNVLYESDGWMSHPRISRDGESVAFVEHPLMGDDRGDVCIVDKNGEKRVLSAGWVSALGLAWSPDGREIWFTASDVGPDNALRAVDLAGNARLVAKVPGRLILQDIDRRGRVLLVSEKIRVAMYHWSRTTGETRDLSWLGTSVATDISRDGRTVLFNEQGASAGTALYAVYLREIEGTSAVRLGDGLPTALSPDGRWALAIRLETPPQLVLLPTGAGSSKPLEPGGIVEYQAAAFFPEGDRVLFAGREAGGPVRLFAQALDGSGPEPVSPEIHPPSYFSIPVSNDGRYAAALDPESRLSLYPLDGGSPKALPGLEAGDLPLRFRSDGRSLYVLGHHQPPARIYAVEIETGKKELMTELHPFDPAGAWKILLVSTTPDADAFAYSYRLSASDLYLMETSP